SRREEPFTPYAPEPVATGTLASSPEQEALLVDSVGLALLVVLDQLAPAERIAFVLQGMFSIPLGAIGPVVGCSPQTCRGSTAPSSDLASQRDVVEAFLTA